MPLPPVQLQSLSRRGRWSVVALWPVIAIAALASATAAPARAGEWLEFSPANVSDANKHVVLIAGDEEYRSEEALPMLAGILSKHHGFRCTVLFSVDGQTGEINPNELVNLPGSAALDSADLIVMAIRWRAWEPTAMDRFAAAYRRGTPLVALRTSTHPFKFPATSPYVDFNKFGKRVVGEDWVSHWGHHKVEGTVGVIEPAAKELPLLNGVSDVFGDTDVYEAYPPEDATIVLRGQIVEALRPDAAPVTKEKKRRSDGAMQPVNDPMMPVAWFREHRHDDGTVNRVFTCTMGSATDLANEGLRRLLVNAVFWGLKQEIPAHADVTLTAPYEPTFYGSNGFRKGVKPADLAGGVRQ